MAPRGLVRSTSCRRWQSFANAIDHAIGRLTELPMSPPRIVAALAAGQADD